MKPAQQLCSWCGDPADLRLEETELPPVDLCAMCLVYYCDLQSAEFDELPDGEETDWPAVPHAMWGY